ncbi:hypothetical protein DFH06DRAFT_1242399 [Mycena polygramma]|nr:hypothetical protein DFH06DRAFT_1242399 [Mycena polygramma]
MGSTADVGTPVRVFALPFRRRARRVLYPLPSLRINILSIALPSAHAFLALASCLFSPLSHFPCAAPHPIRAQASRYSFRARRVGDDDDRPPHLHHPRFIRLLHDSPHLSLPLLSLPYVFPYPCPPSVIPRPHMFLLLSPPAYPHTLTFLHPFHPHFIHLLAHFP